MRTKDEVLARFSELSSKRLKQRKARFLCRSNENCVWNKRLRVKNQGQIGFCINPAICKKSKSRVVFVCNDAETAERCDFFECRNTVESVSDDFEAILRSPAQCGHEYPKLAILIWFLQDFKLGYRSCRFWKSVADTWNSFWRLLTFRWW